MGLLLGASARVLSARRFTNRSCHALSSRPKVRMPCPITTLHSDPATEHACNTVEPALAVVQGRARGEHARRLGALGRAGIRAANIQRLLLVQSGRSWCCSSRAWARCLRPQLTAVVNYLLSVKGDRHCHADWHEGITPSFPRSPHPPARITSSALSQTCLRVPQWALCFLSRECLSAHASRCPFFWHQSFRRRRPRRRAAAANFAADDDADVVALTTIALALATPPLWKAATAADTADADAAPTTITVAAAGRGVRLPLRGAGLQLVLENAAIWRVLRLSGESIPFISIGQPAVHAARGRSLF